MEPKFTPGMLTAQQANWLNQLVSGGAMKSNRLMVTGPLQKATAFDGTTSIWMNTDPFLMWPAEITDRVLNATGSGNGGSGGSGIDADGALYSWIERSQLLTQEGVWINGERSGEFNAARVEPLDGYEDAVPIGSIVWMRKSRTIEGGFEFIYSDSKSEEESRNGYLLNLCAIKDVDGHITDIKQTWVLADGSTECRDTLICTDDTCSSVWYCVSGSLVEVAVGDPAPSGWTGGPYKSEAEGEDYCFLKWYCVDGSPGQYSIQEPPTGTSVSGPYDTLEEALVDCPYPDDGCCVDPEVTPLYATVTCSSGCSCVGSMGSIELAWDGLNNQWYGEYSCGSFNNAMSLSCSEDVWSLTFITAFGCSGTPVLTTKIASSCSPVLFIFDVSSDKFCDDACSTCQVTITE